MRLRRGRGSSIGQEQKRPRQWRAFWGASGAAASGPNSSSETGDPDPVCGPFLNCAVNRNERNSREQHHTRWVWFEFSVLKFPQHCVLLLSFVQSGNALSIIVTCYAPANTNRIRLKRTCVFAPASKSLCPMKGQPLLRLRSWKFYSNVLSCISDGISSCLIATAFKTNYFIFWINLCLCFTLII